MSIFAVPKQRFWSRESGAASPSPATEKGEMPEWSIGPHSKCGVRATVPGVRIPLSPLTKPDTTGQKTAKSRQNLIVGIFLLHDNQPLTTIHKPKDDKAQSLNCIYRQFATH